MTKDTNTTPVDLQDAELDDTNGGFYDEVEIHFATPKTPKRRKGANGFLVSHEEVDNV